MNDAYGWRDFLSSSSSSSPSPSLDVADDNSIAFARPRPADLFPRSAYFLRRKLSSSTKKTTEPERRRPRSAVSTFQITAVVWFLTCSVVDAKVFSTQVSQRVVETRYGRLRGILVELPADGLPPVDAYLGLEYGSLHSGELRFLPPTSPATRAWPAIRTAMKFKPVCPQPLPDFDELQRTSPDSVVEHLRRILPFIERQQEDCLHLNVYVPVVDKNDTSLLPVVIFVHGESYQLGTGNAYDGSVLAAVGGMIVVTINYRLGVLGFLSTHDVHAPGNYALLDQVAALRWVADNIRAFGGDPTNVTLMGHGVGGAMVNLLMLSPTTAGRTLFQRAIVLSGTASSSWASVGEQILYYTKSVSDHLNCTQGPVDRRSKTERNEPGNDPPAVSTRQVLQCIRRFDVTQLVNAASSIPNPPKYTSGFAPTIAVDSDVLPGTSVKDLVDAACSPSSSGVQAPFANVALMTGVSDNEGFRFMSQSEITRSGTTDDVVADDSDENNVDEQRWQKTLRTYVQNTYQYHRQKIYDVLDHNYRHLIPDEAPAEIVDSGGMIKRPKTALGASPSKTSVAVDAAPETVWRPIRNMAELLGDGQYSAPAVALAASHTGCAGVRLGGGAPTFLFTFQSRRSRTGNIGRTESQSLKSGGDRDLLSFLFGAPLVDGLDPFDTTGTGNDKAAESDKKLSTTVMKYFANFIRSGNPNGGESPDSGAMTSLKRLPVEWPRFTTDSQKFIVFGDQPVVRRRLKSRQMALWNELVPRLHRPDEFDTKFHLLDDHNNETLFDDSIHPMRRPIATLSDGIFQQPRQRSLATPGGQSQTVPLSAIKYVMNESPVADVTSSRPRISSIHSLSTELTSSYSSLSPTQPLQNAHSSDATPAHDHNAGSRPTFLLTVGVGCCLFVLNAVVFLIVMCQWRALRHARAARIAKNSQSAAAILVSGNGNNGGHYVPFTTSGCAAEPVNVAVLPTSLDRNVPSSATAASTTMWPTPLGNGQPTLHHETDDSEVTRFLSDSVTNHMTSSTSGIDRHFVDDEASFDSSFRHAIIASQTCDESREMSDGGSGNHYCRSLSHASSIV